MVVLKKFLPDEHVKSIFDIRPHQLMEKGIKGVITDLDNTLVAWDVKDATPEVIAWFQEMKDHDIKIMIISNYNECCVMFFFELLNSPFVYSAKKPLIRAFKSAA